MTRVAFVGNCQAQALFGAYQNWIAPERGDVVHYIAAYEEADEAAREQIRQADLIALQVTDSEQPVNLAELGARGRVVMFPMVTAFFLWPFYNGAHPLDREIPSPYHRVFTGDYGDRWLDRRIAAGEAPASILERYRDPAIITEARLDRLIELVAQKQRERDAVADMALGNYIMEHLTSERVFIHPHHPNLPLFLLMLRELFPRLGCTPAEIARMAGSYRGSPFPEAELPVHPRIAEHLGLKWAQPELAYRFSFGERVTWETFCQRYVAHDWNEPLQRCLPRVHQPLTSAELEEVAADLVAASERYDSAEGYLALSIARHRLGDLSASLAAVERSLSLEPLGAAALVRRAELLAALGKLEEGAAAAEDLVSMHPGFTQARITLFEAYDSLGRHAEALRQARAAFALEPQQPHIVRRLAELESKAAP